MKMSGKFLHNTGMSAIEQYQREKTVGIVAQEDTPHSRLSLTLTESETEQETEIEQMETPLGAILSTKYKLGQKKILDDSIWDEALDKLGKCNEEQKYKALIERTNDEFKSTALMMACMFEPPLKVIKYLVECGQYEEKNALKEISGKDGHTAFHCACWSEASLEVIKHIVEHGNVGDILEKQNEWGYTGLHCACWGYSSLDVIKYLAASGGRMCLKTESKCGKTPLMVYLDWASPLMPEGISFLTCDSNHDKHIPLIHLLRHPGPLQTKAINSLLHQWSKTESIKTDNLASVLTEIQKRTEDEQGEILKERIVKAVITNMFNDKFNMAVIMADLYIQIIVVVVISFYVGNNMSSMHGNLTPIILTVCALYQLIREVMQIMTTPLVNFVTDTYNYIDILQIGLLFRTIRLTEDHLVSVRDTLMPVVIFVAWLKLLFELRMFFFKIAVFVNAIFKVLAEMIAFVFTVSFFAVTFAHMYHVAGPIEPDLCNNITVTNHTRGSPNGLWSCDLFESYAYSFMILLDIKEADVTETGVTTWISVLYAFMMTIVLLNIVIAVISSGYAAIERDSARLYWIDRLTVVLEIEAIKESVLGIEPKLYYISDTTKRQKTTKSIDKSKSNARKCSLYTPLVGNRKDVENNVSHSSPQTGTNDSSPIEDKGFVWNRDKRFNWNHGKRFNWNHDPIRSDFEELDKDEQAFFKWWYEVTNEKPDWWYEVNDKAIPRAVNGTPPLRMRLFMFMITSAWEDIFFPGTAFENIVAGISRSEKIDLKVKCLTLPASIILLLLSNALFSFSLLLGCLSLGILWPEEVKEFVFKTEEIEPKIKQESSIEKILSDQMKSLAIKFQARDQEVKEKLASE